MAFAAGAAVHLPGVLMVAFAERDGWSIPFGWDSNHAIVGAAAVGLLVGAVVITALTLASRETELDPR